ncbi:MAG: diacylglycerol kinase family protein [Oscillospiraceae bacterium]
MIMRFLKSVGYAIDGVALGIKEERNVRVDIVAMLCVWRLAAFYTFNSQEKALIVLITFAIPAFELMNTAVERAVYKPDDVHYIPAGDAKDSAAGGVFVMSIGAAMAGVILFWNTEVFKEVWRYYTTDLKHSGMLILFVVIAYFFVTMDNYIKKEK